MKGGDPNVGLQRRHDRLEMFVHAMALGECSGGGTELCCDLPEMHPRDRCRTCQADAVMWPRRKEAKRVFLALVEDVATKELKYTEEEDADE